MVCIKYCTNKYNAQNENQHKSQKVTTFNNMAWTRPVALQPQCCGTPAALIMSTVVYSNRLAQNGSHSRNAGNRTNWGKLQAQDIICLNIHTHTPPQFTYVS